MDEHKRTSTGSTVDPPVEPGPSDPKMQFHYSDPRLIPGGAHGSPREIGMSAVDPDEVPAAAGTGH